MSQPTASHPAATQRRGVSEPAGGEVGLVVGTEDSTPLMFGVALGPGSYLQLDDVVVTARSVPGVGPVLTSGVVTQVRARHEGASFGSDVFLIADGVLPAQVQEIAEVTTTRVEPECYVPPLPGAQVRRATGEERAQALYFDQMRHKVPVGLGRDGEPIYVNLEFLDGTRGGHVSISGISGVATKTSFALFLLYSIFHSGVLGRRAVNAKALVFSVKGEDLLFLDHAQRPAGRGSPAPSTPASACGPSRSRRPVSSRRRPRTTRPGGRTWPGRTSGVAAFWWTLAEFCAEELLPYVFADAEDERNQYTMVIHQVAARLRREATPDRRRRGGDRRARSCAPTTNSSTSSPTGSPTTTPAASGPARSPAPARSTRSCAACAVSQKAMRTLVRGDLPTRPGAASATEGQQVTVVDLHNLPERAQRFVVGVVLAAETARKEAAGPGGLLFTMIDELNKYAPREGSSPIKEVLLDIAERGRSLGIILIGAQQTASEVERRIVSNSSIKVVGRLDPAEAGRPEYGFLPASQRQRATLAKPGTMFVAQPEIPVPLAVEFPFPAWATRLSESAGPPSTGATNGNGARRDPFSRLPPVADDDDAPF